MALSLVLSGCSKNEDDGVFEENPDERIEAKLLNYKDQLVSSEQGWKVRFFPDNSRAGGWTFVMNFNDDNTVEMIGDVASNPEIEKGIYELLKSQGPVLNFGSFLPITRLVNPTSSYPQSRYGSNEFIFTDDDFTGIIEMISKRNGASFDLEPASEQDWSEVRMHEEISENLAGTAESVPSVYRYFSVSDGNDSIVSSLEYDSYLRFMTLKTQGTDVVESRGHGIAFTPDSIILNPAVVFKGEEIDRMLYVPETKEFVGRSGNVEARIYYNNKPAFPDDSYLVPSNGGYAYVVSSSSFLNSDLDLYTTDPFRQLFLETNANFSPYGLGLASIQLHFNISTPGSPDNNRLIFQLTDGVNSYYVQYLVDLDRRDNKLYLIENGNVLYSVEGLSFFTREFFEPIIDFYTDPQGLYVDNPGNFLNYSNDAYTFVSASKPNVRTLTYFIQ